MTAKRPFEAVVVDHGPAVLRVCRAIVGPVDADDAWSETFLSALRAYPDLPADANVEAWLVTIAHRKAVDLTRARARRAVPTDEVPETAGAAGPDRDDDLAVALARLPAKQKQAVAYGFRNTVLRRLPEIGYGHTASYAAVAKLAGNPKAVRAVGSACATNPLPVVVPCHRVVRSDGAMGGYLGGVEAKRILLALEAAA